MADTDSKRQKTPCTMIIFGASGDLTTRKLMPSLYSLDVSGLLDPTFRIIGFARTPKAHDQFRREMKDAVGKYFKGSFSDEVWGRFSERLFYIAGQYDKPENYEKLIAFPDSVQPSCPDQHFLFYLAIPPSVMKTALETMQKVSLFRSTPDNPKFRIMVEKPFGLDLSSAKKLNELLSSLFDESHIYRIDHYIAKDTIRNLLILRFANIVFEPIWNRNYIDNVQITAAETIGIEGRGSYYEETGIVRDMVQNHVLQVLALIAMESPVAGNAESIQDQKLQVFRSLAPIEKKDAVFGQYRGYLEEKGVKKDSVTPTFVALRLHIDNWRWHEVPFFIRAGKKMAKPLTEVVIEFKQVPVCVLDNPNLCRHVHRNRLHVRIQPNEGIHLTISAKSPEREDKILPADMDFRYDSFGMDMPEAYERVIMDGLNGDPTLFWRGDGIESAWKVMDPILMPPEQTPPIYEPGAWGPAEADQLLKEYGRNWLSF